MAWRCLHAVSLFVPQAKAALHAALIAPRAGPDVGGGWVDSLRFGLEGALGRQADCQSAAQQIANLRYEAAASSRLHPHSKVQN